MLVHLSPLLSWIIPEITVGEGEGDNHMPEVAKTGLRPTTAITTALVDALLHYIWIVKLSTSNKDQHVP